MLSGPKYLEEAAMRNYKDLLVWQRAHRLTLAIYKATEAFPKDERFGLTSQIRRASSSIAANLAEGCGRRSDGEMGRFVQIAMGSGAELSYHLLLSHDLGILGLQEFSRLSSDVEEVMRMLSALSARVKSPAGSSVLELRARG
jgi:four helix bundle protein